MQVSRQAGNAAAARLLSTERAAVQRQHVQLQDGTFVGDIVGGTNNRREQVLAVLDRLHSTWGVTNPEYATAAGPIRRRLAGGAIPLAELAPVITGLGRNEQPVLAGPVATALFGAAFTGGVGQGQPNAVADILLLLDGLLGYGQISQAAHTAERAAVTGAGAPAIADALIPQALAALTRFKVANVAGAVRRDVFVGVRAPTASTATRVSGVLNPGSRVRVRGGTTTYTPPPAMTGNGPGGPFETDMLAALRANVGGWAADYRRRSATPATMPVAGMVDPVRAAQEELERHFGPYITVAARDPADRYHPGSYDAGTKVAAASSRVIGDGNRLGWTMYWMTLDRQSASAPYPQEVLDTYHPDQTEQDRVRDLYALGATDQADIDDAIHGWPAEAGSPTIYVDEHREFASVADERQVRWDIFTTALHEILHILAHPNYRATCTALGSTAEKYLNEGLLEVLRHDVWDGPTGLATRLASPEMAGLRRRVEGAVYPYDASVVSYHPDYGEYQQGKELDGLIGRANTKAAFFLGHTDLLGLGSASPGGIRLAGLASYEPADRTNEAVVVPRSGETPNRLAARVGVPVASLRDNLTGGALPPASRGTALAATRRIRVLGIRYVRAVAGDTVGSIARQNGVTAADVARANALPRAAPTAAVAAGTRLLIPPHDQPY